MQETTFMIKVEDVVKEFKIQKHRDGFWGGMKDLFFRQYEIKRAVDGISFEIADGEIVAYIGPNGAGKSTMIKILTGILTPTCGFATINGIEPYKRRKENAYNMGVVFGQRSQLWWDISVKDSLELYKEMYKISDKIYKDNLEIFFDVLGIGEFCSQAVRQLSLGQRMRADLACAMLHNPKVLYLDEPTIGLDVVAKSKVRNFIREINHDRKTTVMLTTHDMKDIEKLCNRVIVIDNGRLMYDGLFEELKNVYCTDTVMEIQLKENVLEYVSLDIEGVNKIECREQKLYVLFNEKKVSPLCIIDKLRITNEITDFKLHEPDIESVIQRMYMEMDNKEYYENVREISNECH